MGFESYCSGKAEALCRQVFNGGCFDFKEQAEFICFQKLADVQCKEQAAKDCTAGDTECLDRRAEECEKKLRSECAANTSAAKADEETCVKQLTSSCMADAPRVESKELLYDAASAKACVDKINAAACAEFKSGKLDLLACDQAVFRLKEKDTDSLDGGGKVPAKPDGGSSDAGGEG